jgi:hypothetical protein
MLEDEEEGEEEEDIVVDQEAHRQHSQHEFLIYS